MSLKKVRKSRDTVPLKRYKTTCLVSQEKLSQNFPNIAKQMAALSCGEEEQEAYDERGKVEHEEEEEEDEEEEEEEDERFRELAHDVTSAALYEHHQLIDPSSEAEAFNNVASGIAASLGLEQQQQQQQQHILLPDQSGGDRNKVNCCTMIL